MRKNCRLKKTIGLWAVCFFCLTLPLPFSPVVSSHAKEIVVIVNKKNSVSSLSLRELQKIFLGKKKIWEDGENITLFLPPAKS